MKERRPAETAAAEVADFVEMRFIGSRRNGAHAVRNWMINLFDGPLCYLNEMTGKKEFRLDQPSDNLGVLESRGLADYALLDSRSGGGKRCRRDACAPSAARVSFFEI